MIGDGATSRRRYLASAGCLLSLAGCIGTSTEADGPPETAPSTEDGPRTDTPEPTAEASVVDHELVTRDASAGMQAAVTGSIENTGDAHLGYVEASGKYFGGNGDLLDDAIAGVRSLAPGETWEVWLPYPGDATKADRASLEISDAVRLARDPSPPGMVLQSDSLDIPTDEHASPIVSGRVENERDESDQYLEARTKLFAGNGNLLGTGIDTVNNFSSGEVWNFETAVYFNNTDWKSRIDSHETVLTQ